jgi:hypothetical protein
MIAMAKSRLGRKTAIFVTNASQNPVTVTMGFIDSSSALTQSGIYQIREFG